MKNACPSPGPLPKSVILWCVFSMYVGCTTTVHPDTAERQATYAYLITPSAFSTIREELKSTTTTPSPNTTPVPSDSARVERMHTVLEKLEDTIAWNPEHGECFQEWRVVAPENFGLAVEFHSVDMKGRDFLEICSHGHNSSGPWRNFTRVSVGSLTPARPQTSTAPLLLWERKMVVRVTAFSGLSSFNLSYTALNQSLPRLVEVPDDEDLTESDVTYTCAGMTRLPEAIACDGVRHCAGAEDEANCSYAQQGCDDWVPYKNHCLKVQFVRQPKLKPGHSHITMPLQAEYVCQSHYNATLATLPDQRGIQAVVDLIRRSGFKNAVVGIKKVKPVSRRLRHLYRYLWQWGERGSAVAYEQQELQRSGTSLDCAVLVAAFPRPYLQPVECVLPNPVPQGFVCMRPNPAQHVEKVHLSRITFPQAASTPRQFPAKVCPDGSLVQTFHVCHWQGMEADTGQEWSPAGMKLFQCHSNGQETIHYWLLCDGKTDCKDGSDEINCKPAQFSALLRSSFICRNAQAISADKRCNGVLDCFDESDEESCISCGMQIMCRDAGCIPRQYSEYFSTCPAVPVMGEEPLRPYWPARVRLDGYGMSRLGPVAEEPREGLFCCREGYCIPSCLLNNGERDCPHGEDEGIPAQNMTCPGFYRCQGTGSCVHADYVCDGVYHCPNKDDEMYCDLSCPEDRGCTCEGLAYTCSRMIDPLRHLHVRYLDLSYATGVSLENVYLMEYLFYLNLSFCQLTEVTLKDMPQLQTLDLSFNFLTSLHNLHLSTLTGLSYLDLSNNPFIKFLSSEFKPMPVWGNFQNLRFLKMVNVSLRSLEDQMFVALGKLQHLDIQHNPIARISKDCFLGLRNLKVLHTDESKLCCGYFHSSLTHCFAPVDELSSCTDLLAKNFFRVSLWAISLMAITGNTGVIVYRSFINTRSANPAFRVLVMNLCASDLLMGIYMMIIGVADIRFHGNYVANEYEWRNSVWCMFAGVLSFVSSEVSAFVICLITLDRLLVICFPLKPRIHLSRRTTLSACCGAWVLGLALAAVPFPANMDFYGQNGICLPLPITRRRFSGQTYAFGIFIVLNFVLFLLIGAGQVSIYQCLHRTRMVVASDARRQQDLTIARRLFLVVFSDLCCWFPIGLLGILAASGVPIPGQVNVWVAIFVLPVNSALNPFLYTLNNLKEQWRRKRRAGKSQGGSMTMTTTNRF